MSSGAPGVPGSLLSRIALETPHRRSGYVLLGVDGVDGSGKTTFAVQLAEELRALGREALVIHADHFLNVSGSGTGVSPESQQAAVGAVAIVKGPFLHRDSLTSRWDYSVFLDVPFAVTAERMAAETATRLILTTHRCGATPRASASTSTPAVPGYEPPASLTTATLNEPGC